MRTVAGIVAALLIMFFGTAAAQDKGVKQDVKTAADSTGKAVKKTGKEIGKGTKKAAKATADTTEKAGKKIKKAFK